MCEFQPSRLPLSLDHRGLVGPSQSLPLHHCASTGFHYCSCSRHLSYPLSAWFYASPLIRFLEPDPITGCPDLHIYCVSPQNRLLSLGSLTESRGPARPPTSKHFNYRVRLLATAV